MGTMLAVNVKDLVIGILIYLSNFYLSTFKPPNLVRKIIFSSFALAITSVGFSK